MHFAIVFLSCLISFSLASPVAQPDAELIERHYHPTKVGFYSRSVSMSNCFVSLIRLVTLVSQLRLVTLVSQLQPPLGPSQPHPPYLTSEIAVVTPTSPLLQPLEDQHQQFKFYLFLIRPSGRA